MKTHYLLVWIAGLLIGMPAFGNCSPTGEKPAVGTMAESFTDWLQQFAKAAPAVRPSQSAAQPCVDPSLINPNMFCLDVWDPVCGCNGVTYSNGCYATYFGGVTSYTPGECGSSEVCINPAQIDPVAVCPLIYAPVCGCDGNTYSNDCFAFNNGVTSWTQGECDSPCINPAQIDPVAVCPLVYAPVCGCDGNTYSNDCFAFNNGVTSWTQGECPNSPADPCTDLAGVDLGPCDLFLGYGLVNGVCAAISGCSTFGPDGTNYDSAIYPNLSDCKGCEPCINPNLIDPNIFCLDVYQPVCGCDGNTYPNGCVATFQFGVSSYTPGECESQCVNPNQIDLSMNCLAVYQPVCGCDGNTYSNDCVAFYYGGVTSWTQGECDSPCINLDQIDPFAACPLVYAPVCGCDGITYSNDCFAFNSGVTSWTQGECSVEPCIDPALIDPNIACITLYDPVCGCDGNTYSNGCVATYQFGITSYTPGECPPEPCNVSGGTVSSNDPRLNLCRGDGYPNIVQLTVTGNTSPGRFGVVNQSNLDIVASNLNGIFNFEQIPAGQYFVGFIAVQNLNQLNGVTNLSQINGCSSISNTLPVTSIQLNAGTISTSGPTSLCTGTVSVTVSGNQGPLSRFVLFNSTLTAVLAQNTTGVFNMNPYPDGTYRIVHISYTNAVNLNSLAPPFLPLPACLTVSNQLLIFKNCNTPCVDPTQANPNQACPLIFDPVCGCNGVTYPNSCVASVQNGVTSWTQGACPSAGISSSPNPTQGEAWVTFSVPVEGLATLEVHDLNGRKLAELARHDAYPGQEYRVYYDGRHLPNGVYLYRLTTTDGVKVHKFVIGH